MPFTSPENWHKMSCSNFPQIFFWLQVGDFAVQGFFFHLFLMAWLSLAQLRQWISACCFCFWKYLGKLYVFKFGSNNANFLNWRDQNYFQNFFLETYQCSTLLLGILRRTWANGTSGQVGQLPTALMDTVNKPLITGAMNQDCFGV